MSLNRLETFKKKWNGLHKDFNNGDKNQAFLLRLRRAISWLARAEYARDLDAKFIFFWISFNALYARDPHITDLEHKKIGKYFRTLLKFGDARKHILGIMENDIFNEIEKLLRDKFGFSAFWNYHHDIDKTGEYDDWEKRFKQDMRVFESPTKDVLKMLSIIFYRLYTLRNQLMHGGATWGGGLNETHLRHSVKIMHRLLPVFIELTLENPDQYWGEVFYPRVAGIPIELFTLK